MDFKQKLQQWANDPVLFVREAFGANPSQWQAEALQALVTEDFLAVRSGHGVGKLLTYNTFLETPDGERRWGDIQPGDRLFGRDGRPTTVLHRYDHTDVVLYRVHLDDGTYVDCCEDHLWSVKGCLARRRGEDWQTLSTKQMIEMGVKRKNGASMKRQFELPTIEPVYHPKRYYPVHPYVLGAWLGDGTDGSICNPNADLYNRLSRFDDIGPYHKCEKAFGVRGLAARLRVLGICGLRSWEKYVPKEYMRGSVEQRKELLHGLMDTDAECGKKNGCAIYTSTSKRLAEDVASLVRSLGGKAYLRGPFRSRYTNDEGENHVACRDHYQVTVRTPFNPFTRQDRAERYGECQERYLKRWIDRIERLPDGDGMCVTVDAPDSIYLANDYIPTHNTAFLSWAIFWFLSTRIPAKIPCTAPTGHQLSDVLWAELGIWLNMMEEPLRSQYLLNTERLSLKGYENSSFAVARTARKENPDAFQGFHATHLLFVCDEASGIDDKIFEVGEGAMSTPGAKTLMTGNPTKTSGYFYDAFHKMSDFWWTKKVACLDVEAEYVNQGYADRVAAKWGADSNVYRVRVLGEFPSENDDAVIPYYLVEDAAHRDVEPVTNVMPVWGLDVARFGSDKTALCKRRGNSIMEPIKTWRKRDTMEVAGLILNEYEDTNSDELPSEILVDVIGIGAGVVDRLRELGLPVRGVNVGEAPSGRARYMRLRDELWFRAREWFERRDVSIPDDEELIGQLTTVGWTPTSTGKIKVWSKDEMKDKGMDSPDLADAFCLTMCGLDKRGVMTRYERPMRRHRARCPSWYVR